MTFYLLWFVPPIALVLLVGWGASRVRTNRVGALRALPGSRYAPIVAGMATALAIWVVWGSVRQVPVVHDEASYLLQAETFARGRWSMPSPPIPAFFEQYHVFVTPVLASKYPPGHGLLLVPGIWLGVPGLMPLLFSGLSGALLFLLVRRVTNGWIAALTILLWVPLTENLVFRTSYLSETTSSFLWLLGWWALLEWKETDRERWLVVVAACVGWMAITRPLTAVAFALPIGAVVLYRCVRSRSWRVLARPILVGMAIVSIIPLWSARVTGNWRETPYSLYGKTYFPFDKMGFGLDSTRPQHALTPDMEKFGRMFEPVHAEHTAARLPAIFLERWEALFSDAFHGPRFPLFLFALVSLAFLPAAGWFAVAGSVLLTICYLVYAHPAPWNLYYLEIIPLLPFLTACGIWATWRSLLSRNAGAAGEAVRDASARVMRLRTASPEAALAGLVLGVLLLAPAASDLRLARRSQGIRRRYQSTFATVVAQLPGPRKIVFIRYAPSHDPGVGLIVNDADLQASAAWLVHDRGPDDAELMARAPDRVAYLYDEQSGDLRRLTPPGH